MRKKEITRRLVEAPRVQIEEALRHARGIAEMAQTAVISPNASPHSISDALATAVGEIDRATALIMGHT